MSTTYLTEIDFPFPEAVASLVSEPKSWRLGVRTRISSEGNCFVGDIGLQSDGTYDDRELTLTLDQPANAGSTVSYRVTYEPLDKSVDFPEVDGELLLIDGDKGVTRVELRLEYQPPASIDPKTVDTGLLFRLGWVTVNDVLMHLCRGTGRRLHFHSPNLIRELRDGKAA